MRDIINAKEAYYAKQSKKLDCAVARLPSIPKELLNQFLTGPMIGEAGIAFKQPLIERSLSPRFPQSIAQPTEKTRINPLQHLSGGAM